MIFDVLNELNELNTCPDGRLPVSGGDGLPPYCGRVAGFCRLLFSWCFSFLRSVGGASWLFVKHRT